MRETQRDEHKCEQHSESEIIGDMNECSDGVDRETRRGRWLRRVRRGEEREEDV